jgi:hypothetical protein
MLDARHRHRMIGSLTLGLVSKDRNLDSRTTYVVGVSLLLGLAREVFPAHLKRAAPIVHLFTGSMMSIGVMSAFLRNLVFRIGAKRSVVREFEKSDTPAAELEGAARPRQGMVRRSGCDRPGRPDDGAGPPTPHRRELDDRNAVRGDDLQ